MRTQPKIKKRNALTDLFYVLFVACYLVVLLIWGMGASFSQLRYYVLALAVVVAGAGLMLRKKAYI